MKRALLAVALSSLSFSAALADGYTIIAPEAVVLPAAPAKPWQGFYAGAHFGTGMSQVAINDGGGWTNFDDQPFWDVDGGVAGIHAGYNLQSGNLVFGAEIDYTAGSIAGSVDALPGNVLSAEIDGLMSARARLGYATGKFMVFGTAGVARASGSHTQDAGVPETVGFDLNGTTYGVGIEYLMSDRFSVRAEYRGYAFDMVDLDMTTYTDRSFDAGDLATITIGASFHF